MLHITDYNLAGLATLSGLLLFFPGVGLVERRRQRREQLRRAEEAINRLMLDEAGKIVEGKDKDHALDAGDHQPIR